MMVRPIDASVREEIRTDLGTSTCVEAGAGTGKTTSLVSRIVELVAMGAASADSLVVITFTEPAAAELSARVRDAISAAAASEGDAVRRNRLIRARKELYRAHIETIHAFASAILRERPVEAELDPQFEVLSGLEKDLAFDAAYEEWLDELLAGGDPSVGRALNLGVRLEDIRRLAETLDEHRFLLPLEQFTAPAADTDGFVAGLEHRVDELRSLETACTDESDQAFVNLRAAVDLLEEIRDAGGAAARERLLLQAGYHPKGRSRAGSASRWGGDGETLAHVREIAIELSEDLSAFKGELRSAAMLGVLPRVEEFVARYERQRRLDGRPDFDDLLIWARDLLRTRLEVRRYFQQRFSHVLIDEFQDTDPIQVEIAMYLTSDGQTGTEWRDLEPAPGKLFVVGDPKQSIYRFRRADIAIYDEVKRHVLSDGLRQIRQNFRSVTGIIDWVNSAFDRLLTEEEGLQPANESLASAGEGLPPGVDRPPVVVLHGPHEKLKAPALREAEAKALAGLLQDAITRKPWPVRDRDTGDWRPARWGDVAILMPTRSGLDAFESALADAGVPHRHAGARDYFRRQEVRDLIHILRAVDDPGDGFSVVGALRSSAFGCSDADLTVHRAGDGEGRRGWNYHAPTPSPSAQVETAFEVLRDLNRARRGLSLAELVRRTIDRSHLVEFALTLPDGPQAAANLLAIGQQAQSFAAAGGGGLRAFTRWLVRSVETESQEVDAAITEDADDVVHLMTIHGAKGLEFPIVVLGNLESKGKNDKGPVVDEPHTLHLQVGTDATGHFSTPGYHDRWEEEKRAHEAERIRLLYVAATRARDHLVIPCFRDDGAAPSGSPLAFMDDLLPVSVEHREVVAGAWHLRAEELTPADQVVEEQQEIDQLTVEKAFAERQLWQSDHAELIKDARREVPFQVASSMERSSRPMTSEASSSSAALLLSEGPPIPIGDALHLVMEKVSLPTYNDLDEVVTAVCADGGLEEHEAEVRELAVRCLESPTVVRAIESGTAEREVPFTIPTEDGGFLTGRMDLVFRDGDEYVIVDYKTDSVEPADLQSHAVDAHGGQAEAYLAGLGQSAARVCFVFPRVGGEAVTASR